MTADCWSSSKKWMTLCVSSSSSAAAIEEKRERQRDENCQVIHHTGYGGGTLCHLFFCRHKEEEDREKPFDRSRHFTFLCDCFFLLRWAAHLFFWQFRRRIVWIASHNETLSLSLSYIYITENVYVSFQRVFLFVYCSFYLGNQTNGF